MRTLICLLALSTLTTPAEAALTYMAEFNFPGFPPGQTLDVVFGVRNRPIPANPGPPVIESFIITATGSPIDVTITEANAASYGIDWPLWLTGFGPYPVQPNLQISELGRKSEFEVDATFDEIDYMRIVITPFQGQPAHFVSFTIDGSGFLPEPITPEPHAFIMFAIGGTLCVLHRSARSVTS